jgi:archaeal flagellin FlaB
VSLNLLSTNKGDETMKTYLKRFVKDESGITALETAIILIAFVVVAAVFAFTVLSTGTFLTERSKEAAYAGLQEVQGSMEIKGSVVLDDSSGTQFIVFNLSTVSGGSSVDLTKITMTYLDSTHNTFLAYDSGVASPTGASNWAVADASDPTTPLTILDTGGLAKFTVQPPAAITADQTFTLDIKPQTGAVLQVERTAPAQLDSVTDLH